MDGVLGCPYCGGEVEVIKLVKKKDEKKTPYRIECRKCRELVARGFGFAIESKEKQKQRIRDYEKYMDHYYGHNHEGEESYD